jgi:hypothetical protein
MRFMLQRRDYVVEPFDVGGANPSNDCSFQIGQVVADTSGLAASLCGQRNHEGAAIRLSNFSCY